MSTVKSEKSNTKMNAAAFPGDLPKTHELLEPLGTLQDSIGLAAAAEWAPSRENGRLRWASSTAMGAFEVETKNKVGHVATWTL
jgi:hypothetical protein